MFTGIIENTAKILSINAISGKKHLRVAKPVLFDDLKIGCSIACDGICLTVTQFDSLGFDVEIMNETLEKSTAKSWQVNRVLNLERALKLDSRLDGHWLQGHVDRTLRVESRFKKMGTDYLQFEIENEDRHLLVKQGSVAINGTSLTIAELRSGNFSIALIGTTLLGTNLAALKAGDLVNVEYDIIGKYIYNMRDSKHEL
ncbi:MAG: riboflavin synthase [Candidatus Cloacimonetes bacterium]|nr:riboflavin synthase [Candidatus Cloacimonadota bacterium]